MFWVQCKSHEASELEKQLADEKCTKLLHGKNRCGPEAGH